MRSVDYRDNKAGAIYQSEDRGGAKQLDIVLGNQLDTVLEAFNVGLWQQAKP
ncbi:hypothetical protein [Halioxenophilus aromaticivorans]|uniref:Uncharacterized protein n=1 Tax=Halioxenophilus aromaticivorans TaxID=1306992 RepID=A0AAV3TZF9_9ALTE